MVRLSDLLVADNGHRGAISQCGAVTVMICKLGQPFQDNQDLRHFRGNPNKDAFSSFLPVSTKSRVLVSEECLVADTTGAGRLRPGAGA